MLGFKFVAAFGGHGQASFGASISAAGGSSTRDAREDIAGVVGDMVANVGLEDASWSC